MKDELTTTYPELKDFRVNPRTGEVFYTRPWHASIAPEKHIEGAHGLNALADCEAMLDDPAQLSAGDRQFLHYVVRSRFKYRPDVPGRLVLMLSDEQNSRLITITRKYRILKGTAPKAVAFLLPEDRNHY